MKKLQVSLIHYNVFQTKGKMPPLGLMYLSAYLKQGHFANVDILDLMHFKNPKKALFEYLCKLEKSANHLIGFYMNTPTRFVVRDAINMAKKIHPDSIVCTGGPHPTLDRETTLATCSGLDILVIGEGEETFFEITKTLSNDFDVQSLIEISGISLKIESKIVHNPMRPRIKDLDMIPFPDREAINIQSYEFYLQVIDGGLQKKLNPTTFISSRGCPYDCIFCSVADQWGRMTTYHSPERVCEEIKYLIEKYEFNSIYFFDDTFTLNRNRVFEICKQILEKNLNFYWFCEIRANTVDHELLSFMYKAGLRSVAMGIESANPRILEKVIKKGIRIEEATKAVEICKKLGIFIKTFFSYSYPGEKIQDVKMSLNYAKEIMPDSLSMTKLVIYPGTPLYKYSVNHNMLPDNFSWFQYYPFYYSANNETVMPNFVDQLTLRDFLSIEKEIIEISKLLRKKKRTFLYMIKILINNLKKIKSPKDFILVFHRVISYILSLRKKEAL